MRFLLDTNVVSDALEVRPPPKILDRLALHEGHLAIASVTWHELLFGLERLPLGRRRNACCGPAERTALAARGPAQARSIASTHCLPSFFGLFTNVDTG